MLTFLAFLVLGGFLAFGDDFGAILLSIVFYLVCVIGPVLMVMAYT